MSDATLALQKAVLAALAGDAATGALIGDRIHDAAPRNAAFPYLAFGSVRSADWSTGTEAGAEHRITLHAWSRGRGRAEVAAIAAAAVAALDDADLDLDGHHLVGLRWETTEIAGQADSLTWQATMRFRAVTEPG